jgi:uncharacterized peroxidase-related enzyme
MPNFTVPTKDQVSENNQAIFDNLNQGLGFVPNLYAYFANSENALGDFLGFANRKTTLSKKEQEVINLAVSQVNACEYCKAAHTAIAGMNGFTNEQILELRQGRASFDAKFNTLATFAREIAVQRGKVSDDVKQSFLDAGFTEANLVDTVTTVGEITITNYLHNITNIAIDFPLAPALEATPA